MTNPKHDPTTVQILARAVALPTILLFGRIRRFIFSLPILQRVTGESKDYWRRLRNGEASLPALTMPRAVAGVGVISVAAYVLHPTTHVMHEEFPYYQEVRTSLLGTSSRICWTMETPSADGTMKPPGCTQWHDND